MCQPPSSYDPHAALPHRARARVRPRFFIVSFGLQYPRATLQAWLYATLLHVCSVLCLIAPLKIWFFAVPLPGLIRGKLQRRLRHPKRAAGAFSFRTPMRDSAAEYLAAQHAHLPIARFLMGLDAGTTDAQPTPPPRARIADGVATARSAGGLSLPPSSAPPSAPILDELLHLGDALSVGGDPGDERSAIAGRGWVRARSRKLRRRTCGTTLALVMLSLVLFMPANLQGVVVEEAIVVLVSVVMVAALEAARIARLFTAAWGELIDAHGAPAVVAPIAVTVSIAAGMIILYARRRVQRRAEKARLGGAFETNVHRRKAGV